MFILYGTFIISATVIWLVGRGSSRRRLFAPDVAQRIVRRREERERELVRQADARAARPAPYSLSEERARRYEDIRARMQAQRETLAKAA